MATQNSRTYNVSTVVGARTLLPGGWKLETTNNVPGGGNKTHRFLVSRNGSEPTIMWIAREPKTTHSKGIDSGEQRLVLQRSWNCPLRKPIVEAIIGHNPDHKE
ncbi:MAG: hypothetical protein ABIJ34_09095 [archaeon]|nr:hypothetical protein [Candidatus Micrarchaeota archaeon]MBU1166163.1 hypothetical protein [Candidatus Micrarchaeota archaeon]MBU1886561.1 hypothetical protein [Candidatus Micrarchaeota archaeon]